MNRTTLLGLIAIAWAAAGCAGAGQHCQSGANGTQCYNDQFATQAPRQQPEGARPEGSKPGNPMPAR